MTEYMLAAYNIDSERVYISGYSGGGGLFAGDETIMGWLLSPDDKETRRKDGKRRKQIGFMTEDKKRNTLNIAVILCCLAFGISACGTAETDTASGTDRESNIKTVENADTDVESASGAESDVETEENIMEQNGAEHIYLRSSTVGDVISDPYFEDFGRLLFPVDLSVSEDMTLEEISNGSVYIWYNYIDPDKTVEIIQSLHDHAAAGDRVFYDIYSEEEKEADPSKEDTGLFFFRGNPDEKFAVVNAGGGFMYVGAMQDSFPHALELSKMGYNSFALIYRPDDPYADLAQASAVIMQYTGYSTVSEKDAPTYVCVGTSDGIANWRTMQSRLQSLAWYSHGVPCLRRASPRIWHWNRHSCGRVA